jgi:beta-lactamase superfamily II metal-dependent hydrolase
MRPGALHRRFLFSVVIAAAVGWALFPSGSRLSAQQVATITLPLPGATKALFKGCNSVALTFPDGTPAQSVANAVGPSSAVESIWRYDAAQTRFEAFSPAAPQASDLLTVNFLDAVWICVTDSTLGPSPITAPATPSQPGAFSVHFIDVGQGDAILVESGDADILVDGGPSGSAVLSYLAGQQVPDIDLLVATHPHADHIGGLDDVLAQYSVHEVWTNGATATSQTYQTFATAVAAEGAVQRQVRRGYSAQLGGLTLTALHPVDPLTGDTNGDSIVLRLSCGSMDVLLTGDATESSEASMLADTSVNLEADVLKVGHHGSRTSTTNAFLNAVTPQDAVISVGAGNTYGHPTQETLNRLAAHGTTVYRTDLNGTVVLSSDCNTYSISTTGATPPPQPTPSSRGLPPPPDPAASCDPCYPDVCIPVGAADYDCAGGSGNGPNYIQGPVRVVCHPDPHGLDGNSDGWGCE